MTGPPKSCDAVGIAPGRPSSMRQPAPAMSDDGRSARLRVDVVRGRQPRSDGGLGTGAMEHDRQQKGWRVCGHQRSRQLDQRAERAMIVCGIVGIGRTCGCVTDRRRGRGDRGVCRERRRLIEVHMAECQRELERQRSKRQPRSRSSAQSEPAHGAFNRRGCHSDRNLPPSSN
jgi:hypothetical protein